jgi:putative addiction module component (TIGR02574 family)
VRGALKRVLVWSIARLRKFAKERTPTGRLSSRRMRGICCLWGGFSSCSRFSTGNDRLRTLAQYNFTMEHDAAELLRKALQLPEEARAALAGSLWASLDHEVDEDAEAWRQEIRRRLQEIDSGAVKLIPWQDVRRELLDRLEQ